MSVRKYTDEQFLYASQLRSTGMTRLEISQKTGIKLPSLKKYFKQNQIVLSLEQHQKIRQDNATNRRLKSRKDIPDGSRRCSKCSLILPLSEFSKDKNRPDGVTPSCKACQHKHYLANQDAIKERMSIYRLANLEKVRESSRRSCEANKDKRRHKRKLYRQTVRHLTRARGAKRKAAKLRATPPWLTQSHFEEMKLIYKNCPVGHHVDHIVPLQGQTVCGLHVPWNLQYLTAIENHQKNNRLIQPNDIPQTNPVALINGFGL